MKIKNALIVVIISIIGLSFSGCSKSSCTLNVMTSYSGWGEDGHDLGSGEFSESISASSGDVFYERSDGHWILGNKKNKTAEKIATIKSLDKDGVTIVIGEEETVMNYNIKKNIDSNYVVYDGTNYKYQISFTDYSE